MGFDAISYKDLEERDPNEYVLIDIRTPSEYKRGHIPGAINKPYNTFEGDNEPLDRNYKYILYCQRGGSSLFLARQLDRLGYDAYSLNGGMAQYRAVST